MIPTPRDPRKIAEAAKALQNDHAAAGDPITIAEAVRAVAAATDTTAATDATFSEPGDAACWEGKDGTEYREGKDGTLWRRESGDMGWTPVRPKSYAEITRTDA